MSEPAAMPDVPDSLVLAVDDVRENLVGLEALLTQPGVRVVTATSGREALEILLEQDVALAILDVQMPEMSGFELAELMRGSSRTRHVPIVFLTAGVLDPGGVFQGYEAGGVDFLVKPVDPHLLRSKVGVFVELTRQRRLLAAQVEQMQTLQRTSEILIGVLGHDLRNPLNAIALAGETLVLARPDDEMAALIAARIRSASQRMSRLIAQILDFAALRSGSWPIQPRDADLAELCGIAANEFEELARREFGIEVEGSPMGSWDPDRILQVFSNLIGNALQHGAASTPVAVKIDGTRPEEARIAVTNGGELSEAVRATLFAPFGSGRETRGGAGLGLYIVDQVARAHGGDVAVTASGGETTFTVRLPRGARA